MSKKIIYVHYTVLSHFCQSLCQSPAVCRYDYGVGAGGKAANIYPHLIAVDSHGLDTSAFHVVDGHKLHC